MLLVCLLAWLFNPLPRFHASSRAWLLRVLVIITTARLAFFAILFLKDRFKVKTIRAVFLFQVANKVRAILSPAVRRLLAHGSNDKFRHDIWRHAVHHLLVLIPGAMGATQGYLPEFTLLFYIN